MIYLPRVDLFLSFDKTNLIRVAAFKEYKPNEMVFSFYGINASETPKLSHEYSDRLVTKEDLLNLRVNYEDAKIKQNHNIDHFTIHNERPNQPNGEFHLKIKNKKEYSHKLAVSPSSNDLSPEFLDFIIMTDFVSLYKNSPVPQDKDDITINCTGDSFAVFRFRFSGSKFNLKETILQEERALGKSIVNINLLNGSTIKGGFTSELHSPDQSIFKKRPRGTYLLMTFRTDKDHYLLKIFVFS